MTEPLFSAVALTLFPDMFPGPLGVSLAGKALEKGLWSLKTLNIRDFSTDRHSTVDDSPYGGGTGMVLKPDVVHAAVEGARRLLPRGRVVYLTPRGVPMTQALVEALALGHGSWVMGEKKYEKQEFPTYDQELTTHDHPSLIIVCGRFEGLDQRVIDHHDMLEVSLGDFVLSGGEIAALALLDACVRLLPGVIGKADAIVQESFARLSEYAGLLEYPLYTRPPVWMGRTVPDTLLSGNHEQIKKWRLEQAKAITAARRPDLLDKSLMPDKKEK